MAAPPTSREFWRVNSYSYPNPFNDDPNDTASRHAWDTLRSFFENDGKSYSALKAHWSSPEASRKLNDHALESWKATFEEFGLLYVISRSDVISITPAGWQLKAAADSEAKSDFAWIGLNLLFRYPLGGPPRGRSRSEAHNGSNILPYRFLYSAMRDLGDYFWWTELERILCRVFQHSEANAAVENIRYLRANPSELDKFPLPVDERKGAFYNSLNQVANHAGMNHLVLLQDGGSENYGPNESKRRHLIHRNYLSVVSVSLGDSMALTSCAGSAMYVDRLPTAPRFTEEGAYFDYLGARVPDLAKIVSTSGPQTVTLAGDVVFVLKTPKHFTSCSPCGRETLIEGHTSTFCRIARGHRVIISTDLGWTYVVVAKDLTGPHSVKLTLRQARPISNVGPIEAILFGDNDA